MKKTLAILLALMLVLVNVAALAAGGKTDDEANTRAADPNDTSTWTTGTLADWTVPINKNYTVTGGTTFPVETLTFTSAPATDNPDYDSTDPTKAANLTVAAYTVSAASNTNVLKITFPTFTKVGLYHFTITEDTGSTQGVSYNTGSTEIKLSVLIVYDYANNCLKIDDSDPKKPGMGITATEVTDANGTVTKVKTDTLTNTYDMGTLTVTKTVDGTLGRRDQYFDIKVTLTATSGKKVFSDITVAGGTDSGNAQTVTGNGWEGSKEVNIKLKHNETVTISNIPAGVSYTIVENSSHAAEDPNGSNGATGYTITYADTNDNETGTGATIHTDGKGVIAKDVTSATTVKNTKDKEIDTGIVLDTVPYVLMMTLTVVGLAVLFVRKREEY